MGDKVLATHKKDTTNHSHVTAEIAGIEGKEFEVSSTFFQSCCQYLEEMADDTTR